MPVVADVDRAHRAAASVQCGLVTDSLSLSTNLDLANVALDGVQTFLATIIVFKGEKAAQRLAAETANWFKLAYPALSTLDAAWTSGASVSVGKLTLKMQSAGTPPELPNKVYAHIGAK